MCVCVVSDAIVAYENAIRCRVILDQKVHENEVKLKLAELCATAKQYEKAVGLFEEVAEPVKGRTNYNAPNLYAHALCLSPSHAVFQLLSVSFAPSVGPCVPWLTRVRHPRRDRASRARCVLGTGRLCCAAWCSKCRPPRVAPLSLSAHTAHTHH